MSDDPIFDRFIQAEKDRLREQSADHPGPNADRLGSLIAGGVVTLFVLAVLVVIWQIVRAESWLL